MLARCPRHSTKQTRNSSEGSASEWKLRELGEGKGKMAPGPIKLLGETEFTLTCVLRECWSGKFTERRWQNSFRLGSEDTGCDSVLGGFILKVGAQDGGLELSQQEAWAETSWLLVFVWVIGSRRGSGERNLPCLLRVYHLSLPCKSFMWICLDFFWCLTTWPQCSGNLQSEEVAGSFQAAAGVVIYTLSVALSWCPPLVSVTSLLIILR